MKDADARVCEVRDRLDGLTRPASDHPASGGHGSSLRRLGLRLPELHAVARGLARDCRALPPREVVRVAQELVDGRSFEGGTGDVPRTLCFCRMLVADHDVMVVKALSWALREAARRDPGAVRRFLERHHASIAPRAAREVRNKLATGLKTPKGGRAAAAHRLSRAGATRQGAAR